MIDATRYHANIILLFTHDSRMLRAS